MARGNSNTEKSSTRRAPKDAGRARGKKPSPFPGDEFHIDYKDVNFLRRFMSDRGKIRARRVTGASTQRQRELAQAIKTARELALLPYSQRTTTERAGRPRNDRGDRGNDRRPQETENENVLDSDIENVTVELADKDTKPERAQEETA